MRRQQNLRRVVVLIKDFLGAIGTPIPGWLKPPPLAQSSSAPPDWGRNPYRRRPQDLPYPCKGNVEGSQSPKDPYLKSSVVSSWLAIDHRRDHDRFLYAAKDSLGVESS